MSARRMGGIKLEMHSPCDGAPKVAKEEPRVAHRHAYAVSACRSIAK